MKKCFIFSVLFAFMVVNANAQLPANPWEATPPQPNDGYFGDNLPQQPLPNVPNAPLYEDAATKGQVIPVDPWAYARDRSGIQTWRGSGKHGNLNYVGEATTYGTAYGQEMIAPEVNRHNMIVGLEHLRKLGYKIPKSYDQNIKDMPKNYAKKLRQAFDELGTGNTPADTLGVKAIEMFEDNTGLDTRNLLFNSIDLLGTD